MTPLFQHSPRTRIHLTILSLSISLFILYSPLRLPAQETLSKPLDKYHFTESFPSGSILLKLSKEFLIPDSERVFTNDSLLIRGTDYDISYIEGAIHLFETPQDTVIVEYDIFPWDLRRYYYRRIMPEAEKTPSSLPQTITARKEPPAEAPFKFNRSGSIFRSITVGSDRDASLESGMELQLNGRLGDKTTVTAALSDQNIPLQPEGDTRTLEEIDKVYVTVQAENMGVNLGDYNLAIENRRFASLNRKLTGAQGFVYGDNYSLMASGASSKGEFRSISFNGVEGIQGPYQLTGKNGETGILALAGTEKVWVDGILKTRGENYDYIIDYSQGEITFTESVPISAESRIVVDFEYSSGDYPRNLYHSAGEISAFNDKLTMTYALAQEADAKDDPLAYSLSDDARTELKAAGDNPLAAALPGENYVGANEGDYIKIETPDSSYFVYVGKDSGDYDVAFSYIGGNLGAYDKNYSATGEIYYEWVGEGWGDYAPLIQLPLPKKHQIGDFGLNFKPLQNIGLGFEGAVSRRDLNTYSPLQDGDNTGLALTADLRADSLELPVFTGEEQLGFSLLVKDIDDQFRSIDRVEEAEYNRKWGFEDTLSQEEKSYLASAYLIPSGGWKLNFGGGFLEKQNFQSTRKEIGLDYTDGGKTSLKLYGEDIRTEAPGDTGYWRRGNADLQRKLGSFTPGFYFEGEDKDNSGGGFRFLQYKPSLLIASEGNLLLEYTYREDDYRQSGDLLPLSVLHRGHLKYEVFKRNSDLTLDYTHSERDYSIPDSADVISDLGRLDYNRRTEDGAVIFNFKHRISQSRTAETVLIPIEVGWGEGDYIEQGGQYFPDENGNYILLPQQTGNFIPGSKVKSSLNLRVDFRRMGFAAENLPPWIGLLSTDTYFSVEEESKSDDPWRLYVFYLPAFRSDSTLYGSQTTRQDIYYRRGDRDFSMRVRLLDNRSLNNNLVGIGRRSIRDEYSSTFWKSLSAETSIQSTLMHSREYKWLGESPDKDILFYTADNLIYQQLFASVELRLGLKYERATEKLEDLKSSSITTSPQLDINLMNRGRVSIFGSWTGVYSGVDYLPYEMTGGRGVGSNYDWGASVGYRIGDNLNLNASYNGESKVGRPVIHTGRMELRAFF